MLAGFDALDGRRALERVVRAAGDGVLRLAAPQRRVGRERLDEREQRILSGAEGAPATSWHLLPRMRAFLPRQVQMRIDSC